MCEIAYMLAVHHFIVGRFSNSLTLMKCIVDLKTNNARDNPRIM